MGLGDKKSQEREEVGERDSKISKYKYGMGGDLEIEIWEVWGLGLERDIEIVKWNGAEGT